MSETPDRTESIFAAAVAKATAEERAAYLDQACSGDADLRGQVEALLRAHERAGHLLDRPVPGGSEQTRSYTPNEQPGAIIAGRYKLLEAIGEGGMGTVWVAEQSQPVKRKVALKLIKAGMDSKSVLARFEAERQALAVMDHPNIAKVLDGGLTETGRPYFIMEYVKGVPITEYCDATRMSVPERLNLFVQVCSAVQHAHQKGIIHRDLKPSNILVAPYDDKPVPKVIDFGLAKAMHQSLTERTLHTAHETVLGTPLYMSPEQAQLNNLDVDTRSDIYSLGVLLYELLTGTTPLEKQRFKEAAWDEIKRLIREEEPPRPSTRLSSANTLASLAAGRQLEPAKLTKLVRGELDWIVMKSLEKDRARRYETANGFALDIQRYLAGEPVLAAPPSARYRLSKFARKHQAGLTTAAVIALLLITGTTVSAWQAMRATQAEAAARDAEQEALKAQEAEKERAEGERLAKLDAEAKRIEAKKAQARAEAGEKLAGKRLIQVEAEKKKAEEEKKASEAVKGFLKFRLLTQADPEQQADTLLYLGSSSSVAKLNPTILELLDRATKELAPDTIEVSLPKQPLTQAEILQTVGDAYRGVGKYEPAIDLLKRSEALYRQHVGPTDPRTLDCMTCLARAYQEGGKRDLSLPILEETFKLQSAALGPDHHDTIKTGCNLGSAYDLAGKTNKALTLFEGLLQITKSKFGPAHPQTLTIVNNLATANMAAGRLDLALPLLISNFELQKTTLGREHPQTLTTMNNLASAYSLARNYDLAIPLFEEALNLQKAKLGPEHPQTLKSMNNLAAVYQNAGKRELAIPLLEEAIKLQKAKLGPEHPDTLLSSTNLARAYHFVGKLDLALPLYVETFELMKSKLGFEHPRTLLTELHLAEAYYDANDHAEAEKLLRKSLAIREKMQPNLWTTFHAKAVLGAALLGQKKYADAEPLLLAGYKGMKQREMTIPLKPRPRIAETSERLVQLYEATDKRDEAAKWRKILESHSGKVVGPVHEVGEGLELRGQLDKQNSSLVYQLKLEAGKTYVIDMVSPDQKAPDPYLVLTDAASKRLAEDDDSGGGLNARITFRADQAGVYRVRATSFNAGVGPFKLTVREQGKPPKNERN
jgi:serine/threonine protein kinase